ncbi:MAG: MBOAT family protein [Clostridia bacterium]|nr:MBOAT family protein [Clostridia bacterium]
MVFSSLFFLFAFLPLNLILYYSVKKLTLKNFILIGFSLFFYAWGEPVWITLLIFSATIDFFHGKIIEKNRHNYKAKLALISSIVVNLSLLGLFKYSGFFASNLNWIFQTNLPYYEFGLPIGISFYTFQTLSYTFDVYKGEIPAQKHYHRFLLFVSLFHQLVAGPIVRYQDIAKEIDYREVNVDKFSYGINRFVSGLGKKVLIANTAGDLSRTFLESATGQISVLGAWLGIGLFAIQIYFDFSGYSDMAIGLGRMFGFTYKENFNYPYISRSATEFWRRWHISLGSFFRDYVYIPLGGNKKKPLRNLLVVWFLTGMWHGAHWNFIIWGMFYGCLIILEKGFLLKIFEKIPRFISHGYLLVAALVGWVFFYYTDLNQGLDYLKIMFGIGSHPLYDLNVKLVFVNNLLFISAAILLSTPWPKRLLDKFANHESPLQLSQVAFNAIVLIVSVTYLVGATYNPFLYFRF